MGILGQANMSYNNAMIKMSKLQGAQVGTSFHDVLQLLQLSSYAHTLDSLLRPGRASA